MSISPKIQVASVALPDYMTLAPRTGIETTPVNLMVHIGGANAVGTNVSKYFSLLFPHKTRVNRIIIKVVASAGNIDVGIYNSALSRLASTGSVACPAVGYAVLDIAEVVLDAGWYIAAIASSNVAATFSSVPIGGISTVGYQEMGSEAVFPLPAVAAPAWVDSPKIWMRYTHS